MKNILRNRRLLIRVILLVAIIGAAWLAISLRESTGNENFVFREIAALVDPTFLMEIGDGRLFVTERQGRIMIIDENHKVLPAPFLDIRDLVDTGYIEQGLLGLAFSPDYADDGYFYINYTDIEGRTVVARYSVSANDPNHADHDSANILIQVDQPGDNHNGGHLLFGPDNSLYIGLGDGGNPTTAQDTTSLLGSILRIDVSGEPPYAIPEDNPFIDDENIRPEIWAYGLRNPWRFSFDRLTHDLFIGDVGESQFEEINFRRAGEAGGENYGWAVFEGTSRRINNNAVNPEDIVMPIFEYEHSRSGIDARIWQCSVTGGYVYRGEMVSELRGYYLYGDWCSGTIWTLHQKDGEWVNERFMDTPFRINSFAEDTQGEIYLLDTSGVWKLFPR